MIYSDDGYYLTYFPKRNTIEIVIPQMTTVSNRKTVLTEAEETAILSVVKAIVEQKGEQDDS